jgi:hypothetical protein
MAWAAHCRPMAETLRFGSEVPIVDRVPVVLGISQVTLKIFYSTEWVVVKRSLNEYVS